MKKFLYNLQPPQKAVIALIVANIIWGAASPVFKWSLENITPFTLAFIRFYGAALIMLPLTWKRGFSLPSQTWPTVIWMTFIGLTLHISFFFLGLGKTDAINVPIIASSGPIFLLLFSKYFLHEKPRKKIIWGTIISLMGVMIIISRPFFEARETPAVELTQFVGNLYILIATLAAVGHAVLMKEIPKTCHYQTVTFWSFLLAAISFFPLFVREILITQSLSQINLQGITGIIFGILFSSTLAYSLFHWALQHIQAAEVGVFSYVDPVVATIIAIPLLGEVITPFFIMGSFFVFAGIYVAEGRLHYHPLYRLKPH